MQRIGFFGFSYRVDRVLMKRLAGDGDVAWTVCPGDQRGLLWRLITKWPPDVIIYRPDHKEYVGKLWCRMVCRLMDIQAVDSTAV